MDRTPRRKLNRWNRRWDEIENLAAEVNDALPYLLAASSYVASDGWPESTIGNETHAAGDHADPVLAQVLADLEQQPRDVIAEHLREIDSVTAETLGHLRRVARLKDIIVNRRDPRSYDTGGNCKCCDRYVSGASTDRLRGLYCNACRMAWTRYRNAANERGEDASHQLFERGRRIQLEKEAEERKKREGAA